MDKRKFQRKDVVLDVKLSYPTGESQQLKTRDISDGGLFVVLDESKRPIIGELVLVELIGSPDNGYTLPSPDAVVVRQEQEGIGLSFIEMDFAD